MFKSIYELPENIECPVCEAPAPQVILCKSLSTVNFKGEDIEVKKWFYACKECGNDVETVQTENEVLAQVYNEYQHRHPSFTMTDVQLSYFAQYVYKRLRRIQVGATTIETTPAGKAILREVEMLCTAINTFTGGPDSGIEVGVQEVNE